MIIYYIVGLHCHATSVDTVASKRALVMTRHGSLHEHPGYSGSFPLWTYKMFLQFYFFQKDSSRPGVQTRCCVLETYCFDYADLNALSSFQSISNNVMDD